MLDLVNNNDKIIVATSGGPDSMYLLHQLIKEKESKNLSLIVAHVNHHTRSECDKEALFVKSFSEIHHLPFEMMEINEYQKGHFTEEEARKIRINFFKELLHKYQYDYVVTAHHADDLMETILMKIMRGSTLDAICGIKSVENIQGIIFKRPLLNLTKEKIVNYLQKNNIPYQIDYTNYEENHLRNRLRKKVIPLLKNEDSQIDQKFLKFSNELQELTDYLNSELDIIDRVVSLKDGFIDLKKFNSLDSFLQKEYLKKRLKTLYGESVTKLKAQTYEDIITYLKNPKKKNYLDLPASHLLELNKTSFHFIKKASKENYEIVCDDLVKLKDGILIKKDKYEEKSNFEIHLNSKDLELPLLITNRKPGMKMKVKNLNGSKKVKDILIDEHILSSKKDEIPIMIDSSGKVLWILGIKKSQYDLDKNEKCDIIYKYERKEF